MRNLRIGLVHALHASIAPVEAAFAEGWPEAETVSLYDQSLYLDYNAVGALNAELSARVGALLKHSAHCRAHAILFTGSLFGAAVEAARLDMEIPVLASYEAMIEVAFRRGARLGLVSTLPDTARLVIEDIRRYSEREELAVELETRLVDGAMQLLQQGDVAGHDAMVAAAAAELAGCDALMLSQFSMAPVLKQLPPALAQRTLTAPAAAVARIRELLQNG